MVVEAVEAVGSGYWAVGSEQSYSIDRADMERDSMEEPA